MEFAVNAHAHIPALARVLQHLVVLAFLGADHRGEHLQARAFRIRAYRVHHLIHALPADFTPALRAVRNAGTRPEQTIVVMDLRHRAHRGPGVAARGLLVNGNGRAQALNGVHVRLVHLSQELPGIAGQAFHVPALALGVYGVKGQG